MTHRLPLLLAAWCLACIPMATARAQDRDPLGISPVTLPAELERVLRDYERAWRSGDGPALASLFTEDGMALASGQAPIQGRRAIAIWHTRPGGALQLRALAWATADTVGYIIGGFTYSGARGPGGKFLLALRKGPGGRWLIAADMDNAAAPPRH